MILNMMNVTSGFFFSNMFIACDCSVALQALDVFKPLVLLNLIFLHVLIEKVHDIVKVIAKINFQDHPFFLMSVS